MAMPIARTVGAHRAYRRARRWASLVMGIAFPLVRVELCWFPVVDGSGGLALGILWSALFCGGCWGIWVGSASLAGWCRGAESDAAAAGEAKRAV